MIRIPAFLFRIIVAAVIAECQRKAFNANMYRTSGIGRRQWMDEYDNLKRARDMLQGLLLELRNKKAKTVSITIDSVVKVDSVV